MKYNDINSEYNYIKFMIVFSLLFILNVELNANDIKAKELSNQITQNQNLIKSLDLSVGKEYLFSQNNFRQVKEISNCCDVSFDNNIGRALALSFGTKIQIAEIEDLTPVNLILNIGYSSNTMTFRRLQPILLGLDEKLINGEFEHKVVFDFNYYNLNIAGEVNLYQDLYYRFGIDLGKVGGYKFSQIEQIIKPRDSGVFVNNTENPENDNKRTRNEVNTQFENKNLFFAIENNIIYKLPAKFDKISTFLNIGYKIITNQMLENVDWKMNKLNTSIIISYEL